MENTSITSYWWEKPTAEKAETIFNILRWIEQQQGYRSQNNLRNMRLYGNLDVLGLSVQTYSRSENPRFNVDRLTLNIIQSCCDTLTQKISKNKVKPMFLTMDGDAVLKRKAKKLDKFVQGLFYELKVYENTPKVFLDGAVFGTGCLHVYKSEGKICIERVFIDEIKVVDNDSIYGCPRSLYRTKYIAREVLIRMYPKFKDKIMFAKKAEENGFPKHSNLSDMVKVVEAWHLPSDAKSKDGRHTIAIEEQTFVDEEYTKDHYPFIFFKLSERLLGFFGQGVAEKLTGIQVELNKILRTIERAFHLCVPHMMVENGSKVVLAHLNNSIGDIIKYSGIKPEWFSGMPVHPQYFQYIETLIQKAYEIVGISQLSAQAKKPAGLDSGKALREYNDIESERFILTGQAWEEFHMELARRFVALSKEIYEENPDYSVIVKGKKFIETIKWKEVDMDEDQFQLQVFPTSFLSSTPVGKLQDVQDLVQAGFIPKEFAMKLLDFPDLEWAMGIFNAGLDDIDRTICKIVEDGEYQAPEPFQNLKLGIQMMQATYLKAKDDGLEEERLEMIRQWMSEANILLSKAAPPQAPNGVPGMPGMEPPPLDPTMGGMPPQAVPQAPPVSGLLPVSA